MISKQMKTLLLLISLSSGAFVVWNSPAAVTIDQKGLIAYKTSDILTLDGYATESVWENATLTIVEDYGARSNPGTGFDLQMKFAHNGSHLFTYIEWRDVDQNDTRRAWQWNGTYYENLGGNEDRMTLAWVIGGAAIQCGHNPGDSSGMLFDVWHWKASRTNPAGWVDDKWWNGTGRQSDAKTSGGYSDNSVVLQAADDAEITSKLGNTTAVAARGDGDLPYWDNDGNVINWSGGTTGDSLDDLINGYYTTVPVGSRGDVLAAGIHEGETWRLEEVRAFDTGNADDVMFAEGMSYEFYVAIHDESGDAAHKRDTNYLFEMTISSEMNGPDVVTETEVETTIVDTTVTTTITEPDVSTTTITDTQTETEDAGASFFILNALVMTGLVATVTILKRKK